MSAAGRITIALQDPAYDGVDRRGRARSGARAQGCRAFLDPLRERLRDTLGVREDFVRSGLNERLVCLAGGLHRTPCVLLGCVYELIDFALRRFEIATRLGFYP
ncbi:MAG TPA: hypothetical protein VL403_09625 [Candidatus Kryptonia bacterium]|nr:hypothetical protein [Candidatus Kryptonia bacterium]